MDDEQQLEVFEELEDLFIDTDEKARFRFLSIPEIIKLVTKLVPADNEEDMEIISEWLLPEFQLYETGAYYEPAVWELIAQFTLNLLMKRALKNFHKVKSL